MLARSAGSKLEVRVRLAADAADRETCLRLRWTVFVEEQGVPPSLERDEYDSPAEAEAGRTVHALAELFPPAGSRAIPCGAGRFIWLEPGVAKIQRMAVIDDARGLGAGAALLRFLEDEARRRGAARFTLGAQVGARGFYEKAGYRAIGEVFDDAGIDHLRMDKPA